jgi:murein DD-endopeptidase MepM/ murein hydrolase activator NlpD
MSKLGVKKGQMVSAHEQLGLSGKTGRVTGPHLHWQAVIHQVKVNPMGLVEELK